jgi:hypothetical protein
MARILASAVEKPGPQARKGYELLNDERASKQKKRVERDEVNLCTANKRETRVEREKSGHVHFRTCDRRGLKHAVWGFMAKRGSAQTPHECTDPTRIKRLKWAGGARVAETRKGGNGSEGRGACRCREIPLSVPMPHARSTSGLTGGSKMRNFPLLAKGDVRVLIDRHKAANVIARRRRIPYVVNVNDGHRPQRGLREY